MNARVGVMSKTNRDTFFMYKDETIKISPGAKTTKIYKEDLLKINKKEHRILR